MTERESEGKKEKGKERRSGRKKKKGIERENEKKIIYESTQEWEIKRQEERNVKGWRKESESLRRSERQ